MVELSGVGLGLRRSLVNELLDTLPENIDFVELAPENWMGFAGRRKKQLQKITTQYPLICHGLSLSIGSVCPLNIAFIQDLKKFFKKNNVEIYSEHLSYCGDDAYLYDLMPLPFTAEAVRHVSSRIKKTQDILERRMAIENISYYCVPRQDMTELEFIKAIVSEANCDLLLDINNVYVNSQNHHYAPEEFLDGLSDCPVKYFHVAGHNRVSSDLIIDTHGAEINDPVFKLLERAYKIFGPIPTLLERDSNIPALNDLVNEISIIKIIQNRYRNSNESTRNTEAIYTSD